MIERFHRSLKASLPARAANSDWVSHLPLVLLGLRSVPKEDTGFSVSEAVYGSALTIPGEFLDGPELHSSQFLSKIGKVISGFSVPPPHHVPQQSPAEVPAALATAKFVFVREDANKPSLAPLYHGPYLVLERRNKFFRLQIGNKVDSISIDQKKFVSFLNKPTVILRRNLYRQTRGRSSSSASTPQFLLGGSNVAEDDPSPSRIQRRGKMR